MFSNIDLSNYYTKSEVDDIDNELSTIVLNTYTKTKNDSQLKDYTTITHLQGNYMTALSITETLMNYYATIAFIVDNVYDKSYLDTQFSLKADVPQLTSLVSTHYLDLKCTNRVDLTTYYYKKTDIDKMLVSYSTGSYVDCNLANKVSTTGDATISGILDVGKVLTLKRIPGVSDTSPLAIINESPGGGTGVVHQSTASDQGFLIAYTTAQSSVAWVEGVNWGGSNEFIIKSGSYGLTFRPTGDAVISGNSDVDGIMNTTTINLTNDAWDNFPSVITNNGDNWFQGEYIATANQVGCLFRYKTSGSSTYWWTGVWGSHTNDFNIWFKYQGLSLKSNGSVVLSCSLTQNSDASLKDNVEDVDLTDCTNMLENINVKTYTRNDMEEGNKRLGFIAQDVKAYLPDKFDNIIGSNIITDEQGENSKELMTMDYVRMVCVL